MEDAIQEIKDLGYTIAEDCSEDDVVVQYRKDYGNGTIILLDLDHDYNTGVCRVYRTWDGDPSTSPMRHLPELLELAETVEDTGLQSLEVTVTVI